MLGNTASVANVALTWKQQGALMGTEKIVEWGTVKVGGTAGALMMPENPVVGRAIGQAVTQGALDIGTTYVSPVLTTAILYNSPGYTKTLNQITKNNQDILSLFIQRRNEARAKGQDTSYWDTQLKNYTPTIVNP